MELAQNYRRESIKSSVIEFINNNFMVDLEKDNISLDESLILNGIIDSTGLIEIVVFIQEKFSFVVNDNEVIQKNFGSVNRIVDFILIKLN